MRKILLAALLLVFTSAVGQPRRVTNMDAGWRFHQGDVMGAEAATYDDMDWRRLDVPHDWSIEGDNLRENPGGGSIGFFPTGMGWYRKTFDVKAFDRNKRYSIEFDGIYMLSTVWINGHELGTWPYGYSSFSYDLTPYLRAKGNVLAVRVDTDVEPHHH